MSAADAAIAETPAARPTSARVVARTRFVVTEEFMIRRLHRRAALGNPTTAPLSRANTHVLWTIANPPSWRQAASAPSAAAPPRHRRQPRTGGICVPWNGPTGKRSGLGEKRRRRGNRRRRARCQFGAGGGRPPPAGNHPVRQKVNVLVNVAPIPHWIRASPIEPSGSMEAGTNLSCSARFFRLSWMFQSSLSVSFRV